MKGWMQMGLALLFWATALQAQEAAAPKDPAPSTTAPAEASTPNGATKQSEQPPAEPSEVPEPALEKAPAPQEPEPAPEEAVEPKVLKPSTSESPASPAPNPAVAEPPASPAPPAGPDSTPAPDAKGVPEAPASGPTGPGAVAGEVGEPAGVPTDQAAGEAANPAEPAPAAAEEKTEPEKPLEAALLVLDPVGGGLSAEQSREYGRYFREQLAQEGGLPPLRPLREQQAQLIEHPSQCQGLDCGAVLGRQLNVREVLVLQLESWEDPGWGTRHRLRATHVDLKGPSKGWWEVTFRDSLNKAYDPVEELAEEVAQALGDGNGAAAAWTWEGPEFSTGSWDRMDTLLGQIEQYQINVLVSGPGLFITEEQGGERKAAFYDGMGLLASAFWDQYSVSLLYMSGSYSYDPEFDDAFRREFTGTCSAYGLSAEKNWFSKPGRRGWRGVVGFGLGQTRCSNRFLDTGGTFKVTSTDANLILEGGYVWSNGIALELYSPLNFGTAGISSSEDTGFEEVSAPTHTALSLGFAF